MVHTDSVEQPQVASNKAWVVKVWAFWRECHGYAMTAFFIDTRKRIVGNGVLHADVLNLIHSGFFSQPPHQLNLIHQQKLPSTIKILSNINLLRSNPVMGLDEIESTCPSFSRLAPILWEYTKTQRVIEIL